MLQFTTRSKDLKIQKSETDYEKSVGAASKVELE